MLSESSSTKGADTKHRIKFHVTAELTATKSYCSHSTVCNSLLISMRKHNIVYKQGVRMRWPNLILKGGTQEISNFLINFLMRLGAGLRNSRKVLTISLTHFEFFCIFPKSKEKNKYISFPATVAASNSSKCCFTKTFSPIQLFYYLLLSFSLNSIH